MPEKKKTAAAAPAVEAPAAEAKESKTRKSAKASARRGRPPLAPELYVEFSGKQYNVTDIIDRAKADYRATHKVGVQSCKVYVKPEEDAAYYVINKVSGKLELLLFLSSFLLLQSTPHLFCGRLSVPTQGSILNRKKSCPASKNARQLFILHQTIFSRSDDAGSRGPGPGSRTHSAR